MKPLLLAPRSNGQEPETIGSDTTRIIIMGANGAGKTRFASYVSEHNPDTFKISALQALYNPHYADPTPGGVDHTYNACNLTTNAHTQAERLTVLMLQREMAAMLSSKLAGDNHAGPSQLDRLISLWQEIFPGNRILVQAGKLLASRKSESEPYPSVLLSSGERAVLYIIGATLNAPHSANIYVDAPDMFLHPSLAQNLWNRMETERPDCRFIYVTHSIDFATSRLRAPMVWVRAYNPLQQLWNYELLPADAGITEPVYSAILGERKPVLFVEGDAVHSIDSRLYPLIFPEYSVRPLGSCNKVIEATRSFNDLSSLHHLDSYGIVDRDRRNQGEVDYLRNRKIMVPDVAEIENILLLPEVMEAVAQFTGKDSTRVVERASKAIISMFAADYRQQALLHTRHMVKRTVEMRIDARFSDINTLERHLRELPSLINAKKYYRSLLHQFNGYIETADYRAILRVYNQKSILPGCNVAGLCGLRDKKHYIATILHILSHNLPQAGKIRTAIKSCLGF